MIGQVDAVILCTPTQMHAAQAIACLNAGKHVQVEIPLADSLRGAREIALGIAMDMSIQLKTQNGAICTLSLSFNNDGPLGTFFRYIGDSGTYIARYDDLFTARKKRSTFQKLTCR